MGAQAYQGMRSSVRAASPSSPRSSAAAAVASWPHPPAGSWATCAIARMVLHACARAVYVPARVRFCLRALLRVCARGGWRVVVPGTGGYLKVTQNLARVCVVVESVDHRNLHIVTLVDPSRRHAAPNTHTRAQAYARSHTYTHARMHAHASARRPSPRPVCPIRANAVRSPAHRTVACQLGYVGAFVDPSHDERAIARKNLRATGAHAHGFPG
jgi:hypothetical protein